MEGYRQVISTVVIVLNLFSYIFFISGTEHPREENSDFDYRVKITVQHTKAFIDKILDILVPNSVFMALGDSHFDPKVFPL